MEGGGEGVPALVAEAPPPNFYYEQARKLLEALVQVQLHFIYIYGQQNNKGNSHSSYLPKITNLNTLIKQSITLIEHSSLKPVFKSIKAEVKPIHLGLCTILPS